jgi:hypothetical protein
MNPAKNFSLAFSFKQPSPSNVPEYKKMEISLPVHISMILDSTGNSPYSVPACMENFTFISMSCILKGNISFQCSCV